MSEPTRDDPMEQRLARLEAELAETRARVTALGVTLVLLVLANLIALGFAFVPDVSRVALLVVGVPAVLIVGLLVFLWVASKVSPQTPAEAAAFSLCPGCGYDLTGNVSGVCPECGTPVRGQAPGSQEEFQGFQPNERSPQAVGTVESTGVKPAPPMSPDQERSE